jgi:hypothetical protein
MFRSSFCFLSLDLGFSHLRAFRLLLLVYCLVYSFIVKMDATYSSNHRFFSFERYGITTQEAVILSVLMVI